MRRIFSTFTIQNKLSAVFGIFMLLAAIVVGIMIINIVRVADGNARLERTFAKLVESYDAQVLIQRLEAAEQGLFVNSDIYALDALTKHSNRLDTFIREALLKAEGDDDKATIYQLQQVKQDHDETIAMLSDAVYEEDEATFDTYLDQADLEIAEMYDLVDALIARDYETMDEVDYQTTTLQMIGMGLSFASLVAFAVLALIAALIISTGIFRPILAIHAAVNDFRAGSYNPEQMTALARRGDEIGKLARAFVTMAEAVNQRREAQAQEAAKLRAESAR